MKLLVVLGFLVVSIIASSRAVEAGSCSIPNTLTNGTVVDATKLQANFQALITCMNNIDNTNIGAAGLYASQLDPITSTQATFGGSVGYSFPYGVLTPSITNSSGPISLTANNGTAYSAVSISGVTGESPLQFSAGSTFLGYIDQNGNYDVGLSKYGNQAYIGNDNVGAYGSAALNLSGDMACQRGPTNACALYFGTSSSQYLFFNGTNFNFGGGGLSVPPSKGFQLGTGTAITEQSSTVASVSCTYLDFQIINSTSLECIDGSGNVGAAGSFYQASERKLKKNIFDLSDRDALALIMGSKPVHFQYKADKYKKDHLGFIADDTPVTLAPDHKAVDIGAMQAASVAVIREQQFEIESLQAEFSIALASMIFGAVGIIVLVLTIANKSKTSK